MSVTTALVPLRAESQHVGYKPPLVASFVVGRVRSYTGAIEQAGLENAGHENRWHE